MDPKDNCQKVTPAERAAKDGHPGLVVWLMGLSGAGKTTLAVAVERALFERGYRTFLLDGDALRTGLCCDLGYDEAARHENARRAALASKLMADAGLVCFTALISPFRADRLRARNLHPPDQFLEVFVNAPLAVCEQRDVKGLYRRARANQIPNFTGITSAFEPPESPDVEVRTDLCSIAASVAQILEAVERRLLQLSKNLPGKTGQVNGAASVL